MVRGINGISASLASLSAYGAQLANIAHNVANVNSDGYKKTVATVSENDAGLPKVNITKSSSSGLMIQVDGRSIETSNVNLAEEIPRMILAQRAYEANIKALKIQNETFKSTIDILVYPNFSEFDDSMGISPSGHADIARRVPVSQSQVPV